ncbi:hypothetical protein FKM82_025575 [Ascaphus truei]
MSQLPIGSQGMATGIPYGDKYLQKQVVPRAEMNGVQLWRPPASIRNLKKIKEKPQLELPPRYQGQRIGMNDTEYRFVVLRYQSDLG